MEWPDNRFEVLRHVQSLVTKGRGCRSKAAYRPWTDFRSRGRVGTERAFKCSKTGRVVNHKSAAHKCYFLLQERRREVVSIEEEFPMLHMARTLEICQRLGLDHPKKNKLPEPLVVSFLVREMRGKQEVAVARSLSKESGEAGKEVSHLDAIREGCQLLGIEWKLVNTAALDQTMLDSLMFARAWMAKRLKADDTEVKHFASAFIKLHRRSHTLLEMLELCSASLDMSIATVDTLFRRAAWEGSIPVDFRFKLARNAVVQLIRNGRT